MVLLEYYQYQCKVNKRTTLSIIPLIVEDGVNFEVLLNDLDSKEFHYEVEQKKDFSFVQLQRIIPRSDRVVTGRFSCYKSEKEHIWVVMSIDCEDFIKHGLIAAIHSFYPSAYEIKLSSDEMRETCFTILEKENTLITSKKAVLYPHGGRGQIDHNLQPIQEVFAEAHQGEKYVDNIKFKVRRNKSSYEGFFSRAGIYHFYEGNLLLFLKHFLDFNLSLGEDKRKSFSDKSQKLGEIVKNELFINFSSDRFMSRDDNNRLLKALSDSYSSIAVFHSNPYLHFSITDFIDGSSFDVYTAKSDVLHIVPRFHASYGSFQRICENIFKGFSEGEVGEVKRDDNQDFSDLVW